MPEERAEVRLAVVVAGGPEDERCPHHEDAGRYPAERDQRGFERAEIGRKPAHRLEQDDPGRVDAEQREDGEDEGGVEPVGEDAVGVLDDLPGRGRTLCGPFGDRHSQDKLFAPAGLSRRSVSIRELSDGYALAAATVLGSLTSAGLR